MAPRGYSFSVFWLVGSVIESVTSAKLLFVPMIYMRKMHKVPEAFETGQHSETLYRQ